LRPGANLLLLPTPTGQLIAGNVRRADAGVMASSGWIETAYRRLDERDNATHRALVHVSQLSGGFRLLIGRDLEERRRAVRHCRPRGAMVAAGGDRAGHSAAASSSRGACCGGSTP